MRELKEYYTMATNSQTNVGTALDLALKKITEVEVPLGKHIALAYWGGLDPTLWVKLSHLKYRARKLTAITVDVGQGETELQESTERAAKLGIAPIVIDAKQEFTQQWLGKAIHANSDYNGYPVATSMTRQLIAAKEEIQLKHQLDAQWANLVYHGEWHHPLKNAIDAFITTTLKVVNGAYTVELYKGNIAIRARSSSSGLFFPDIRSLKSASFNQQECAPAAHLRGLPFELIARRNNYWGEQS
jgi:argininosuccinate synthase